MKKSIIAITLTLGAIAFSNSHALNAQTWTQLSVGISTQVFDLSFSSNDTGFASLGNGTMRKTVDGGMNWSIVTTPFAYNGPLEFISGNTGMIVSDTAIYRTANGGGLWTMVYSNPNITLYDLTFVNTSVGYAAGVSTAYDTFLVYKTLDAGVTWNPCTPIHDWNSQTPILHFRTATEGYLTGSDSIYRTTDGGVTWTTVFANTNTLAISTICAADVNTTYACELGTEVIKSSNGGVTWNGTGQFQGGPAYGSYFINANFGFMCGGTGVNSGFISQTTDGGASWTSPYTGPLTFWSMDFPSATTGYCGGDAGTIMKYSGPTYLSEPGQFFISMYPNPASEFLVLENIKSGSTISISNSLGEIVATEIAINNRMEIDIHGLAIGIYVLQISDGEKTSSTKFIKQ